VGQRLNVSPDGQRWMTVGVVEPNRALVLRTTAELPSSRSFDPWPAHLPHAYLDGIWGFYLQPASGGKTRLVAHTHGRKHPQLPEGRVQPAGRAFARHHAGPPVPWPAHPGRHAGVTQPGRVAGALAHRQAGVRFVPGWRAAARIAPAIGVGPESHPDGISRQSRPAAARTRWLDDGNRGAPRPRPAGKMLSAAGGDRAWPAPVR
jgi:hypothetical protein